MAEEATITNLTEPVFDPTLRQFVAVTLVGLEVFGFTWSECAERLSGANEAALDHAARCPDPLGLDCPLGPCAECPALMRGKCDWEGLVDAGD
jgi:hypothetical protein